MASGGEYMPDRVEHLPKVGDGSKITWMKYRNSLSEQSFPSNLTAVPKSVLSSAVQCARIRLDDFTQMILADLPVSASVFAFHACPDGSRESQAPTDHAIGHADASLFKLWVVQTGVHFRSAYSTLRLRNCRDRCESARLLGLSEAAAASIRTYEANMDRMRYDLYRTLGLPVGSRIVESAYKHIVGNPFKQSGCHLVESGRQHRARHQMLLRKHALARLPRLEGLPRRSHLTKGNGPHPCCIPV